MILLIALISGLLAGCNNFATKFEPSTKIVYRNVELYKSVRVFGVVTQDGQWVEFSTEHPGMVVGDKLVGTSVGPEGKTQPVEIPMDMLLWVWNKRIHPQLGFLRFMAVVNPILGFLPTLFFIVHLGG